MGEARASKESKGETAVQACQEAEKVRIQDFLKEDGKMGKIVLESGMDGP